MALDENTISAIERADSWSSVLTGLGVAGKDKMKDLAVAWNRLTQSEAEQIWAANDIAKRIVGEVVDAATREWIKFSHEDEAAKEAFIQAFETLDVRQKFNEADKTGRALGGAGILIVTEASPDNWHMPLVPEKEGSVKSLVLFSKDELYCYMIEEDISNPRFGLPIIYQIQPLASSTTNLHYVHHSRILRFDGDKLPRRQFVQNNYWHDSVLNSRLEPIRNYNGAHLYSTQAIADFSVTVMKIKNLSELIAAGKGSQLLDRVNIVNMGKAIARMLMIDKDEDFQNISRNVSGLKDLVDCAENRLVASAGTPRTKLLGESPGGLGSNGEGEDKTWNNMVSSHQELVYEPKLDYLIKLMSLTPNGPTKGQDIDMSYDFNALFQQSDSEEADVYSKVGAADVAYIDRGVLNPEDVAKKRFSGDKFNTQLKLEEDEIEEYSEEDAKDDIKTLTPKVKGKKSKT